MSPETKLVSKTILSPSSLFHAIESFVAIQILTPNPGPNGSVTLQYILTFSPTNAELTLKNISLTSGSILQSLSKLSIAPSQSLSK